MLGLDLGEGDISQGQVHLRVPRATDWGQELISAKEAEKPVEDADHVVF